jgi:hypothetical protein
MLESLLNLADSRGRKNLPYKRLFEHRVSTFAKHLRGAPGKLERCVAGIFAASR